MTGRHRRRGWDRVRSDILISVGYYAVLLACWRGAPLGVVLFVLFIIL